MRHDTILRLAGRSNDEVNRVLRRLQAAFAGAIEIQWGPHYDPTRGTSDVICSINLQMLDDQTGQRPRLVWHREQELEQELRSLMP